MTSEIIIINRWDRAALFLLYKDRTVSLIIIMSNTLFAARAFKDYKETYLIFLGQGKLCVVLSATPHVTYSCLNLM